MQPRHSRACRLILSLGIIVPKGIEAVSPTQWLEMLKNELLPKYPMILPSTTSRWVDEDETLDASLLVIAFMFTPRIFSNGKHSSTDMHRYILTHS